MQRLCELFFFSLVYGFDAVSNIGSRKLNWRQLVISALYMKGVVDMRISQFQRSTDITRNQFLDRNSLVAFHHKDLVDFFNDTIAFIDQFHPGPDRSGIN